jgi:hypothetical protein
MTEIMTMATIFSVSGIICLLIALFAPKIK